MTQYARPNEDRTDAEWKNASDSNTDLFASIDESSTDDNDYIKAQYTGSTPAWCKIKLSTVNDPDDEFDDHKIRYRAVGYDSSMMGVPTLIVALYEGDSVIATHNNTSLEDESMMGMGTWADFTVSLSASPGGEAQSIDDYSDLELWFKLSTSNMGDYVKVSQAWFECADVPAGGATTSSPFLLFID